MSSPLLISGPAPRAGPSTRTTDATLGVVVTLLAILMLPGGVFFLAGTSSMSAGVLVASILILAMRVMGIPGMRGLGSFETDLGVATLVVTALAAHLAVCALAGEIDVVKALGSLVIAALAILACGTTGSMFRHVSDRLVMRAVTVAIILFLVAAVFSLVGVQPPSTTATSKPVFPFTEPSLYAGALLPVIAFLGVTGKRWRRWAWILMGFALGYLLENLSLVVGSVVMTVACLTTARLAVFGILAALILPLFDLSYFLDRIQFDVSATTNLSTLVYIQGWEMIGSATSKTLGWGLGFQQLGYTFLDAPTSNLIYRLTGGTDLNLKEGSFAASKLISELGVFGLVLIAIHGYFATKAFTNLRRVAIDGAVRPLGEILALCSIYTYTVDMYVRGAGYFSSPTMLMIASIFLLWRSDPAQTDARRSPA
ncbi:hypothetical protein M0208_10500 [Sphingomonas sp. SUN019]|uniref:hypothetical protein n=1 Tax=Sphingomonas sp. SUN019 TaxID=2937788 RepID=UPI002163FFEF|nr:hypothetical protein [Sphingomonas sp. SUN019]UVO50924.1 hypothetical protein M0208_10500 [Sphingomonas sp. SUN019]